MFRFNRVLVGLGLLAIAPAGFAQYTMDLTGVAPDAATSGNVYVSPYQGTITLTATGKTLYSGFMICDDYTTESYLNTPWAANLSSSAGVLTGGGKFLNGGLTLSFVNGSFSGTYSQQQAYNAAGWLATQLLLPGNVSNPTNQTNYSFAIWNIFDPGAAGSNAAALNLEQTALSTYDNTVQENVSVYTPSASNYPKGINQSQEFLVVNQAPEIAPGSAASSLALLLSGLVMLRGRRFVKTNDAA
ncbi:MAG: hypothetical protein ACHQIL_06565 [Steroidobacterales bacterium]